jgi:hypothetical protein
LPPRQAPLPNHHLCICILPCHKCRSWMPSVQ